MDLSPQEAFYLLRLYLGNEVPDINDTEIENTLVSNGLIYANNNSDVAVTQKGKQRIGNHIVKERNLPDYIDKYSFPEAFNKFFSTASVNAVNALLIAMLNANKIVGIHRVTLTRLEEAIAEEQVRKQSAEPVNISIKHGNRDK